MILGWTVTGNKLYSAACYDIETLTQEWLQDLPPDGTTTTRSSSPAIHRGKVYILRPEGASLDTLHLYELDFSTGEVLSDLELAALASGEERAFYTNGQDDLVASGDAVRWLEWPGSITDAEVLVFAPAFANTTFLRSVPLT